MSELLTITLQIISETSVFPFQNCITEINKAKLGLAEFHPAPVLQSAPAPAAPEPLGALHLRETLGRINAKIAAERRRQPVLLEVKPALLDALALKLPESDRKILRSGKIAYTVSLVCSGEDAAWRMRWLAALLRIICKEVNGVVFDPITERVFTTETLAHSLQGDITGFIVIVSQPDGPETVRVYTKGLRLFAQPEIEIVKAPASLQPEAAAVIHSAAAALAEGNPFAGYTLSSGVIIDCGDIGSYQAEIARDTSPDGARMYMLTALHALQLSASERTAAEEFAITQNLAHTAVILAQKAFEAGSPDGALAICDRVLAADALNAEALSLKAGIFIKINHPLEALEIGQALIARSAARFIGYFITGQAFAALGRFTEADRALTQAIRLNPDNAESYRARAQVYQSMGMSAQAAADTARVHSLLNS